MLQIIAEYSSAISCILTLLAVFVRPVREWLFGATAVRDGQKCLLRAQIVSTYYKNIESRQLRQYEYENLEYCYAAYKRLGGNSFVDHIHDEMQSWSVIR